MKKRIANYSVIIEKQKRLGTNKLCYMAYVPTLGVATDADTIEEVQREIDSLVNFHLESLASENEEIPVEGDKPILTTIEANLPEGVTTVSV